MTPMRPIVPIPATDSSSSSSSLSFSSSTSGFGVTPSGSPGSSLLPSLPSVKDSGRSPLDASFASVNHPVRIRVLLFRGRGLLSALIRWQTGSRYSHAAALVDDTWLYEAWQGAGVRVKPFDWSDTAHIDFFEIADLTPEQAARMLDYLKSRVGNSYDYWGVLRFVTRARPKRNNADFCSEYIYSAAHYAGRPLLARTEPAEVSPGLLSRSPFLHQVGASPTRRTRPTPQFQLTTTS